MITIYALAYRIPEYVKNSIESLLDNASEEICFNLLVNPCGDSRDDEIIKHGKSLVDTGKIKRMVVFDKNIVGRADKVGIEQFPPDSSEKFFIVHDLSKKIQGKYDWIKDVREGTKTNCLYGFDLDISNRAPWSVYDPKTIKAMGLWMMCINTEIFQKHYHHDYFRDGDICEIFQKQGWAFKKSSHKLYHQVWDVKNIDKDYWDMKSKTRNQCNWFCKDKSDISIYEKGKDTEVRKEC